jgi:hypothetical protein
VAGLEEAGLAHCQREQLAANDRNGHPPNHDFQVGPPLTPLAHTPLPNPQAIDDSHCGVNASLGLEAPALSKKKPSQPGLG